MLTHVCVCDVCDEDLTVAVVGVLCSVDVPKLIDGEEPLRSTVEPSDSDVPSFHVVIVPGVAFMFGTVGHRRLTGGPIAVTRAYVT